MSCRMGPESTNSENVKLPFVPVPIDELFEKYDEYCSKAGHPPEIITICGKEFEQIRKEYEEAVGDLDMNKSNAFKVDKGELIRDIMKHGKLSQKDASIILGMKTVTSFRTKLCRGSFSLEDIALLAGAAGLYLSLTDNNSMNTYYLSDYFNETIKDNLSEWIRFKNNAIDAEIERLKKLKEEL